MNKVVLMGRLTRNPDVRYSQGERSTCVARYTLAVNRRFKREGEQDADFIGCVAFGRQGEFAEKYLKQGTKVVISGRIQTGSYTNRDGVKVYTTDVVVEEQDFAESKAAASNYSGAYQQNSYQNPVEPQPTMTSRPAPSEAVSDGFMTIPEGIEEELPFI
jgi:single-strand DNA-binding protein